MRTNIVTLLMAWSSRSRSSRNNRRNEGTIGTLGSVRAIGAVRFMGTVRTEGTLGTVVTLRAEGTFGTVVTLRAEGTLGTVGTLRAEGTLKFVLMWCEGNDPRCRLVMTNVGKEDRTKKPPTNRGLGPGRHCLWENSDFPLGSSLLFALGHYPLSP